jgi:hypothetical protein
VKKRIRRLLELGDEIKAGDVYYHGTLKSWHVVAPQSIGESLNGEHWPHARYECKNDCNRGAEEKLADLEARLRYVEMELQANKDLRQDDLVAEKKWRNPVMPNDYGKQCQFADDACFESRCDGVLCGFVVGDDEPYICNDGCRWAYARIEVTE